jgi:hypothetical protein
MKKRLHDKKAGIAIFVTLFIISLVNVILRVTIFSDILPTIRNYGQVLIAALLSLLLIYFTIKGKDRLAYLLCGVFLGYFVLDQLFDLPGAVGRLVAKIQIGEILDSVLLIPHLISMLGIIGIGVLLIEYMNDGTIYDKAFKATCIVTVLAHIAYACITLYDVIALSSTETVLALLHIVYSLTMVFLSAFFAYDSAKAQLKKTNLSK